MKFLLTLLFVLFALACEPPAAPSVAKEPASLQPVELIYLEELPLTEASPQPILVVMHGYNSNEIGPVEKKWAAALNDRFFIVSVRAPIETKPGRFAWYRFGPQQQSEVEKHAEAVIKVIKGLSRDIDSHGRKTTKAPLIVAGFSQGGRMALEVAKRIEPGVVQGVVALSPDNFEPGKIDIPLLITHSEADPTVSFNEIKPLVGKITGTKPEFLIFEGGHTITRRVRDHVHAWTDKLIDAPTIR